MKQTPLMVVTGGMILFFVAGLILLLTAPNLGQDMAQAAIVANGGSMETSVLDFIRESTTVSYQLAGAVIAAVGGMGGIVFGSFFYKANLA